MPEEKIHVDLCVIGAGSAGLSVAAGAVQLGFDVALIEKSDMGGDCLNTGCVPSKAFLASAKAAHNITTAREYGVVCNDVKIDFATIKDRVARIIDRIAPHDSQERFEGMGVKVFREKARFIARDKVRAGNHIISARYFVIATGSRALIPPIKGLDEKKIFTNENIFGLKEKPEHLIIIGGGPIGVEMAQAHCRLGCDVSVIDIANILPKDDPECAAVIKNTLQEEGVVFYENSDIEEITHHDDRVDIKLKCDGREKILSGSHLLVAAGRQANVDDLDLEKAGVGYTNKGIKTGKTLKTGNKNIYAAGDVAGGPQFTHVAGYHAGIIIRNMMFKIPAKIAYQALPWVTYTDPELAQVGMSEQQARERYGEKIRVVKAKFKENDRAQTESHIEGLAKLVTLKNGRVLGASIAGPHAGELIALWAFAISDNLKVKHVAGMIAPYPTYGEINKRLESEW